MKKERFRAFSKAGPEPAAPGGFSWERLMMLCLRRARQVNDEIPVGALVIDPGGKILAVTRNRVEMDADPTAHAEILAIRQACARLGNSRLPDCVLVTTLEPCLMCAAAISQARLAGVVYGAADIQKGAVSSAASFFDLPVLPATVWHMGGVLAERCASLLNGFFAEKRS